MTIKINLTPYFVVWSIFSGVIKLLFWPTLSWGWVFAPWLLVLCFLSFIVLMFILAIPAAYSGKMVVKFRGKTYRRISGEWVQVS